ncbi:MAG: flavin reductase family protein [Nitriliruptoraceae bacterium]|nr:flavin reductase family protein [Nitriliruptoraceae bacterium]
MTTPTDDPLEPLEPLEFDLDGQPAATVYALLTSVIVPRPIAWVSTVSTDGVANLAPHSWFTQASIDPPCVVFTSAGEKDTLRNVRSTGAFVVNLVDEAMREAMNLTAADAPPDIDEFELAALRTRPGVRVSVPRVADAPAHLECTLEQLVPVGDSTLVVGRVRHAHLAARVRRADGAAAADVHRFRPVARLSGGWYATPGEPVEVARPSWASLDTRT